jgi:hypothetical protein
MQLMNNLSREKYSQLSTSAQRFLTQMASTVAQCAPINNRLLFKDDKLDACVDQINEMDERVVYLEQIARELQEFTSELGAFDTNFFLIFFNCRSALQENNENVVIFLFVMNGLDDGAGKFQIGRVVLVRIGLFPLKQHVRIGVAYDSVLRQDALA